MTIFQIGLSIIAAYLLGSIPSAVWFGKLLHGIDVRQHGSGNAGATNVIRVLGYKAGIPVLLFDVFKGWLAVELSMLMPLPGLDQSMMTWLQIAMALAAVLGHVFPVFAGFRGGKGVGTMAGVGIALFPVALLVVLGIFIVVLTATRYVSLSSVTGALAFPFAVWFITCERHPALIGLAILVALFIPATHWKNIRRLINGTEKKFDFSRKGKEESSDPNH